MPWKAMIETDVELARAIGVSPPAVRKAWHRGTIRREPDGRWDVLGVVQSWRANTHPGLQRPGRALEFRPWLDPCVPLEASIWAELVRRCDAVGVEWERPR